MRRKQLQGELVQGTLDMLILSRLARWPSTPADYRFEIADGPGQS